jgi:hypothetical protein
MVHGVIFLDFQAPMLGGRRGKNCLYYIILYYNIDYFGYADNLEVKFKLNFDEERGKKIGLTLIGINVICEVPFNFVCICQKCYII